jgi:hypothetical protein
VILPPLRLPELSVPRTTIKPFFVKVLSIGMLLAMTIPAIRFACSAPEAPFEHSKHLTVLLTFIGSGLVLFGFQKIRGMGSPRAVLVMIVVIGAILRGGWILSVHNEPVSDFAIYQELAQALVSGKGYALTGPVGLEDFELYLGTDKSTPSTTAYRTPGAAFWLAILMRLGGNPVWLYKCSNVLLSLGTIVLIYLLLEKKREIALTASFLWAIYPTAVMATNLLGNETLFTFCLLLIAWALSRPGPYTMLRLAMLGLLTAWTALVRSMLVALYISITWVLMSHRPLRTAGRNVFVFTLFLCLGLAPWMIRNYIVFRRLIPVCTSEGEFLGRHTAYLLFPDPSQLDNYRPYKTWRALADEAERSSKGYRLAIANWREILGHGIGVTVRALTRATNSTFYADDEILFWSVKRSYARAKHPGPAQALSTPIIMKGRWITLGFYLFLLCFALGGAWHLPSSDWFHNSGLQFMATTFFLFFITNVIVLSRVRYHFAMMPWITILAAISTHRISSVTTEKAI